MEFHKALLKLEHYLKLFAYNFTRNSQDAEDLAQETMLKALTYRQQYKPQTNFKAWVFTIMRNIFINQYRRKIKASTIFDSRKELYLLPNSAENYDHPMNYMLGKDIDRQMKRLEDEYRRPFQMHFEGFKYQEIAEKLEIPIGTVKSRIFAARKKLMQVLPEHAHLS